MKNIKIQIQKFDVPYLRKIIDRIVIESDGGRDFVVRGSRTISYREKQALENLIEQVKEL